MDAAAVQADALLDELTDVQIQLAALPAASPVRVHLTDRADELCRRIAYLTGQPCVWGESPPDASMLPPALAA